jgi:hypothetical protein
MRQRQMKYGVDPRDEIELLEDQEEHRILYEWFSLGRIEI